MFLDCVEQPRPEILCVHQYVDARGAVDQYANQRCVVFSYIRAITIPWKLLRGSNRYYHSRYENLFSSKLIVAKNKGA